MKRSPWLIPAISSLVLLGACFSGGAASRRFIASGDAFAQKGQWSAAAIEYRNALKRTPDSADAHAKLAEAASKTGDLQTLASERLWAAAQQPRDLAAHVAAGKACLAAGRFGEAESVLDQALAIAPQDPAANQILGTLLMRTDRSSVAEPYWKVVSSVQGGDPFALADYYAVVGRESAATRELHRLAAIPALRDAAMLRLARFQYAHGDEQDGDQTLDAALATNDRNVGAWMLRGQMDLRDQPDAARTAFDRALAIEPSSIDALTGLTLADVASGHSDDAISGVETHLSADPRNVRLLLLAGRTYASAQKYDKAEQTLLRLVSVDPANGDAYQLLGRIELARGNVEAARQKFEIAAHATPYSIAANTMLGMLLQAEGQTDAAQQTYEQILSVNPRAAIAANNLAWIYLKKGRLDDSLQYARVADEELHHTPQVDDTLGWVYYTRNQPLDAIPVLAAAATADPNNAMYHFHLGAAYAKADQAAFARRELDRALALSSSFPDRAEALRIRGELTENK